MLYVGEYFPVNRKFINYAPAFRSYRSQLWSLLMHGSALVCLLQRTARWSSRLTVRDYSRLYNLVHCQSLSNPITVLVHKLCTSNILFCLHKILLAHLICHCALALIYKNIWGKVGRAPCTLNLSTTLSSSCHLWTTVHLLPGKYLCNYSEKSLLETQGRLDMVTAEKSLSILFVFIYFFKYDQIHSNYNASDDTVMWKRDQKGCKKSVGCLF